MFTGLVLVVGQVVIGIPGITTEGGYFDDFPPEHHVHNAKAATNQAGVPEQVVNFFGCCVGGYVEVFGVSAK